MTLVEFLLARIAEDEARARDALTSQWGIISHRTLSPELSDFASLHPVVRIAEFADDMHLSTFEHICRWQPSRVLAECEAKRRIIDQHWPGNGYECPVCAKPEDYDEDSEGNYYHYRSAFFAPCPTLHALALPYAGHPDYKTEWAA